MNQLSVRHCKSRLTLGSDYWRDWLLELFLEERKHAGAQMKDWTTSERIRLDSPEGIRRQQETGGTGSGQVTQQKGSDVRRLGQVQQTIKSLG